MAKDVEKLERLRKKMQLKDNSGIDCTKEVFELADVLYSGPDSLSRPEPCKISDLYYSLTGGNQLSDFPDDRFNQLVNAFVPFLSGLLSLVDSRSLSEPESILLDADQIFLYETEITKAYQSSSFLCEEFEDGDFVAGPLFEDDFDAPLCEELRRIMQHILHVAEVLEQKSKEKDYASVSILTSFYFLDGTSALYHCINRISNTQKKESHV
jgi:hypothetical protein